MNVMSKSVERSVGCIGFPDLGQAGLPEHARAGHGEGLTRQLFARLIKLRVGQTEPGKPAGIRHQSQPDCRVRRRASGGVI